MEEEKKNICALCYKTDKREVELVKKHDTLFCPNCKTTLILKWETPLGRYSEMWKENSEKIYPYLRPDIYQDEMPNPRLFFLYEDCYVNMLIGRYNAAIVLMGVLLEALMKERIHLKTGVVFKGAYGPALSEIEIKNLMQMGDIRFLREFKDSVRNLYQHADIEEILRGTYVRVWPIQFEGELTAEKLKKAHEQAKDGKIKPLLLPAANFPAFAAIIKQKRDRAISIMLFNRVYDFVRGAMVKYFKQEEYDEHKKMFGDKMAELPHYTIE